MAYFAWGSSMSTSVAPRAVNVSSAVLKAATIPVVHAALEQAPGDADAGAPHVAGQRRLVVRDRFRRRRGVGGVEACNRLEGDGGVAGAARQRTDLVERGAEGQQPVSGHASVGRLEAQHAAHRRRLPNRPAGVRAERQRREPGGDRHGRPAARPAGDAIERPRIARRPERRVFGRRSHRELVAVGLADDHGAGAGQSRHDRRVVRRDEPFQDLRRGRRAHALRADVVLERHGDAGERRVAKPVAIAVDVGGTRQRLIGHHRVERVQGAVGRRDPIQRLAAHVHGRSFARPDRVADVRERANQ